MLKAGLPVWSPHSTQRCPFRQHSRLQPWRRLRWRLAGAQPQSAQVCQSSHAGQGPIPCQTPPLQLYTKKRGGTGACVVDRRGAAQLQSTPAISKSTPRKKNERSIMRMQRERELGQVPAASANNSKSHIASGSHCTNRAQLSASAGGLGSDSLAGWPLAAWQPHGLTGSGVGAHSRRSTAACTLPPVATRARMLASLHGTWACSQQAGQRQKQHSTPAREWHCSFQTGALLNSKCWATAARLASTQPAHATPPHKLVQVPQRRPPVKQARDSAPGHVGTPAALGRPST